MDKGDGKCMEAFEIWCYPLVNLKDHRHFTQDTFIYYQKTRTSWIVKVTNEQILENVMEQRSLPEIINKKTVMAWTYFKT